MDVSVCLRSHSPQQGLVGEALDAGQLAGQRLVVAPFGVGQAGPARTKTAEQLRHVQFGRVTVRGAHAGIHLRPRADFGPQAQPLASASRAGRPLGVDCFWAGTTSKRSLGERLRICGIPN